MMIINTHTQESLDFLAKNQITLSLCFGPTQQCGICWSVDVLTKDFDSFEEPFAANSFEQAVEIARLECAKRDWLPNY